MTTLNDVNPPKKRKSDSSPEETAAVELVKLAKAQGLSLTGPDGLSKQFTKNVLETALNEELTEHLGHEPSTWAVRGTASSQGARVRMFATGPDRRRC